MLVLSRKHNESIRLPELDVTIQVLQIKGTSVRVGVTAPSEVMVLRGELENAPLGKITKAYSVSADSEHDLRNKLNTLKIAIAFAKKLISQGNEQVAIAKLFESLCLMEEHPQKATLDALLVEDADNEREMLAGFLRLFGYAVNTANDGLQAIDYLESNTKPDLILMDMRLPKLGGAETIRRIRENPAFDAVEIFAVSGDTPHEAGVNTSKNRISHWFQKPLEPEFLVSTIDNHLRVQKSVESAGSL